MFVSFLAALLQERVYHINPAVTPLSENTAPIKPKPSHRLKRNLHTVRPNIAICDAIKYVSNNSVTFTSKSSALSFSECETEIDNSDPFIVWLQGKNGALSHVIVASGYKTGSTNYLYILDPSPNVDAQYFSYTGLVNGSTGTLGTRCYETTIYRQ